VCFSGATYCQRQDVDLAPDAALVLVDWLTAGRHALGERWRFDRYDSQLRIRADGRLIIYDALRLRSTDGDIGGRVGRFNVLALVAVVGLPLAGCANAIVSRVSDMSVRPRTDVVQTASAVGEIGCVLRVAGLSVEATGRIIRDHLSFLPDVLGDDPWTRKW
jgi:urease accessory protein